MAIYKKVCVIDATEFESARVDKLTCSSACQKKLQRGKGDMPEPTPTIDLADETTAEVATSIAEKIVEDNLSDIKFPESMKDRMAAGRQRMNERLRAKGLPLILDKPMPDRFLSTGIKEIDALTVGLDPIDNLGGLPRRKIIEVFGPKGVGKTSLVKTILTAHPETRVLFFDAEGGLMAPPENVNIVRGNVVEEIMPALIEAVQAEEYDLIIVDSIASLVTQKQFDEEKEGIAPMARVFGPYVKKLVAHLMPLIDGLPTEVPGPAVLFTNQFRDTTNAFGNREYTVGGRSMEYYASLRLEFRSPKSEYIVKDGKLVGQRVKVKVEKTRYGIRDETFKFPIMFSELQDFNEFYNKRVKELLG